MCADWRGFRIAAYLAVGLTALVGSAAFIGLQKRLPPVFNALLVVAALTNAAGLAGTCGRASGRTTRSCMASRASR